MATATEAATVDAVTAMKATEKAARDKAYRTTDDA
jgi:hypothetical protein